MNGTEKSARRVARGAAALMAAGLACLAVAGCIPPAPEPSPTPAPAPAPAPPPAPTPAPAPPAPPVPDDWRDAPQTPGDWRYMPAATGGIAEFASAPGTSILSLRCDRARGIVLITRSGSGSQLNILTQTEQRVLPAVSSGGGSAIEASLPARDGLLDAMALSRGRFAVAAPGQQTLYIPAWPEVSRVIEDCR